MSGTVIATALSLLLILLGVIGLGVIATSSRLSARLAFPAQVDDESGVYYRMALQNTGWAEAKGVEVLLERIAPSGLLSRNVLPSLLVRRGYEGNIVDRHRPGLYDILSVNKAGLYVWTHEDRRGIELRLEPGSSCRFHIRYSARNGNTEPLTVVVHRFATGEVVVYDQATLGDLWDS